MKSRGSSLPELQAFCRHLIRLDITLQLALQNFRTSMDLYNFQVLNILIYCIEIKWSAASCIGRDSTSIYLDTRRSPRLKNDRPSSAGVNYLRPLSLIFLW
jgi:hypothetical protein